MFLLCLLYYLPYILFINKVTDKPKTKKSIMSLFKKTKERECEEILYQTLKDLCAIPAPTGEEYARAKYCLDFVKNGGYANAYIDEAKNVIWQIEGKSEKKVFLTAHTDTVFPDRETMPFTEDDDYFKCAGVGDDTACLTALLVASVFALKKGIKPNNTIFFVANSCEEGLGNLKGIRAIFDRFGEDADRMYAFDGTIDNVVNKCVGSCRYSVEISTTGGHSFADFGNINAIAVMAEIINKIYSIELPEKEGATTTYNVGNITGGTSVNTIAQNCSMLCECRSDDISCLEEIKATFNRIFTKDYQGATVNVKVVGERPCGSEINENTLKEMTKIAIKIQKKYSDKKISINSGSTDCNIPQSMGIPAICMGAYIGGGAHTRQEWIKKDSLKSGFNIVSAIIEYESKRK